MTEKNLEEKLEEKLIAAYDTMKVRVKSLVETTEHDVFPVIANTIEKAKQQALELKELSKDEADKLGHYLLRDIKDATEHFNDSGEELATWFKFDLELIESRILDVFSKVADPSGQERRLLIEQANVASEYHTGEITSIGTLSCDHCQTELHFNKATRIPPCPKCHKTTFKRLQD
jgi:hypothetical protein